MSTLMSKVRVLGLAAVAAGTLAAGAGWFGLGAQDRPLPKPDVPLANGTPAEKPPASRADHPSTDGGANRSAADEDERRRLFNFYIGLFDSGATTPPTAARPGSVSYAALVARLAQRAEDLQKRGDADGAALVLRLMEEVTIEWKESLRVRSRTTSTTDGGTVLLGRLSNTPPSADNRGQGPPEERPVPVRPRSGGIFETPPQPAPPPALPLPPTPGTPSVRPLLPPQPAPAMIPRATGSAPRVKDDPNLDALKAVLDRLERIEKRLEQMDKPAGPRR